MSVLYFLALSDLVLGADRLKDYIRHSAPTFLLHVTTLMDTQQGSLNKMSSFGKNIFVFDKGENRYSDFILRKTDVLLSGYADGASPKKFAGWNNCISRVKVFNFEMGEFIVLADQLEISVNRYVGGRGISKVLPFREKNKTSLHRC